MDKITAAAIERLEAEKRRRQDEKVASGAAVRVPLYVVVGGPEEADEQLELAKADKIAELRAAGETREIIFDNSPDGGPSVIITGVPRSGRDPKYIAALERGDYKAPVAERPPVTKSWPVVSGPVPTTPPPASASVEESAEPLAHRIWVQVAPPTETDPGAVIEGSYTLTEGGVLRVYDADRNLLGTERLQPGADARAAARRVLREKKGRDPFWNPIPYGVH
jgi:hypothetical protein